MSQICIDPSEIREGDLMDYASGTASEAVAAHVNRCPACARQARELAALQTLLSTTLYRHSCPEPDRLLSYLAGELQGNDKLVLVQHLRQCPHCARELASVARQRSGLGDRFRAAVDALEATPVTPRLSPIALRGPASPPAGPWVYRAGDVEVLLDLAPSPTPSGRHTLTGLVHTGGRVPETIEEATVELYRGEGLIGITAVSPRGQFSFTDVEPCTYDLRLVWGEREIAMKGVSLT